MRLFNCATAICGAVLFLVLPARADAQKQAPTSAALATYYFDQRDFNTVNITTSRKTLPGGLDIWGFTDFHGSHDDADRRFDLTRYFTEYRLRGPLPPAWTGGRKGLGVEIEYNDASGSGNNLLRVGLTYRHGVGGKGWLQWRLLPYETDETGQQLSLIHGLSLGERVAVGGFTDLHLNKSGPDRWVTESQLSYQVNASLNAVVEVRYNGFEDANPAVDGFGLAVGLAARP